MTLPIGAACFIANKPRSSAPRPRTAPATPSLLSKNGKRLPLRAIPFRDLNRAFWSHGTPVFRDSLERKAARELAAHEKPVNAMTVEELEATQDREPLSESRRAWLNWGRFDSHIPGNSANGILSLAPWDAYSDGSIGSTIVDPTAQAAIEAICCDDEEEADLIDDLNDRRYGTAYAGLDPITQKQIDWEKESYYTEQDVEVRIITKPDGGLALRTSRKLMPDALLRLAKSVKRTLANENAGWDNLAGRFRAIFTDAEMLGFLDPQPEVERDRWLAPADEEWHSSFERIQPQRALLSEAPCLGRYCNTRGCYRGCNRPGCDTLECHRHVRTTRIVHRSTSRSKDELWRTRLFDPSLFELGTDGLVSELVQDPERLAFE